MSAALREIARVAAVKRVSRYRETDPVGFRDQPTFMNAAVQIATALSAVELLEATRGIERRLGRVSTFRNGPRIIDIDLLDVRGEIVETNALTLPHPRMHERRFVLEPLAEIAPRWKHPRLRKTPLQLIRALDAAKP